MRYLTEKLPGIGGAIKSTPSDFVVEEFLPFEPSGVGSHTYVKIEKTNMTTFAAIERLARVLGISSSDIGFAGMKDSQAITRQFLSIPLPPEKILAIEIPNLKILSATPHRHKLRRGLVKENSFDITIREVAPDAVPKAEKILNMLKTRGVPNFYGPQRFGVEGKNVDAAKLILAGEHRGDKRLLRLLVSSYQAHLFNKVLERRLDSFDALWPGDLAWHYSRFFLVDEITAELTSRLASFDISPTGPIFGYRMPHPTGQEAELENQILESENLDLSRFKIGPALRFRGTRRPFRVPLKNLEILPEQTSLRLKFVLPSGSYATIVLAELMK